MSEYGRTAGSYATVYPVGISIYLDDARGERSMIFHGDGVNCNNELFRQTIRGESGRILTDYKADNNGQCNCGNPNCQWYDRFERDYVFLGGYTLVTLKRGETPHYMVLDHLGSPRQQVNAVGGVIGVDVLDAWGLQVAVNIPERTRFTGHERNHVDLDGTLPISDYMHTRTYVPMLGRFTSADIKRTFSLFSPGNMNRYMYANANPAKYVDLFGLSPDSPDNPQKAPDPKMPGVQTGEDVVGEDPFDPSGTNRFLWTSFARQAAQLVKPTGMLVRAMADATVPYGGAAVAAYDSDMTWGEIGSTSAHGAEAFADGVIPFWDPFASAGAYDPSELGLSYSKVAGQVTQEVAWAAAGGQVIRAAKLGQSSRLFARKTGLLNRNNFLRIGWGWSGTKKAGYEVFRISIGTRSSRLSAWLRHLDFF
jgi:RHS repeat-associated protein